MAKFDCSFSTGNYGFLEGSDDALSVDDLLSVIRPAAIRLKESYISTINRLFKRRSGQLADSILLDDEYISGSRSGGKNYAFITVAPYGSRKGSKRSARSRAGSKTRKYAKHNRAARATKLSNVELAYLFEYGTPRIAATHWMENTNEAVEEEIQQMIEDEFHKLLDEKGI